MGGRRTLSVVCPVLGVGIASANQHATTETGRYLLFYLTQAKDVPHSLSAHAIRRALVGMGLGMRGKWQSSCPSREYRLEAQVDVDGALGRVVVGSREDSE